MSEDLDVTGAAAAYLNGSLPDRARASMASAVNTQPDFEARARKLAQDAGIPVSTAREMPEDANRRATLNRMDFDDMAKRLPSTMEFLAKGDNARVVHDDVDNMGLIETTINSFKRGVPGLKQNLSATALRANASILANVDAVEAKMAAGAPVLDTEDPFAIRFMTPEQRADFRAQATRAAGGQAANIAAAQAERQAIPQPEVVGRVMQAKGWGEALSAFMSDPVKFVASIGPESLVQNAPGLVAGAVVPGGLAAKASVMGAGSFSTDYGAAIVEGLTRAGVDVSKPEAIQAAAKDAKLMRMVAAQAMAHALVVGSVDAASGGVAGKVVLSAGSLAGRPAVRELANIVTQIPVQGTFGAAGEAGGQILAGQELQPGEILAEFVGEAFGAPAEVASVAARQVRQRMSEARQAQVDAQALEHLAKVSEASKVRARDAGTFKAFVEQAAQQGDTPTELYVDPAQLANSLNQSGMTMVELEAIAPVALREMRRAVESGTDVRVPVAEFASLGETITAPLIDHLRTAPDAMTRAEATEFMKTEGDRIKADVEQALSVSDQQEAFRTAIQQVRDIFKQQLDEAKRFTGNVNAAYADLLANFFGAQAARAGMTPQQLLQKYRLDVVAQGTGGKRTLNQDIDETTGLPLNDDGTVTVYHHTSAEKAAEIARTGVLRSAGEPDLYFTTTQETNTGYGDTAVPVRIKPERLKLDDEFPDGRQDFSVSAPSRQRRLKFRPDGEGVLYQAANKTPPAAEQTTDPNGLPAIRSEEIELAYAQPAERVEFIPVEGQQMYNLAIIEPGKWEPVGFVELVFEGGKVTGLYDIEVNQDARSGGIGAKVLEAILASNPEADILISNVVPAARRFWENVGIPQQNVGEGDAYDGNLNWNTYADSATGRKRGARRQDGGSQGQGGSGGPGLYGGPEGTTGGILEQGSKQVGPRAQIAFGDDITAAPSVISLLAGADLSSFIHESGHFFLEVQSDLAIRIQQQIAAGSSVGPGERGIVDDMNLLLAWFGIKGDENQSALDVWAGMTLEEKREHHEKFARGFEAYSMEGRAPSLDLQGVFQRFRSWLVQVYKTLKSLNVELTDDVRAVMDRMLATDTAIAEAEAQRNMGALFRDAKTAGMTLEEFNAYQATAQAATESAKDELQARSMADMKWLSRARDKALKERQAEVEELRRQARREVTAEVLSQPVYRAWQFLSGRADEVDVVEPGSLPVGEIDTTTKKGKLRTSALKEIAPDTWEVLSKRRMTSEDSGMHPEIVAELFGFDSGDALVQALVEARPPREVIADLTDQRMLEQHGDITSPAALQRAADEAVHNEARARFITSELKALAAANDVKEKQGKRTVDLVAQAAKQYAQQIIDRLKVRDIRPAKYAAAEVRNGKMAEKAFAKGELEEAAQHKRNQLVNNYATRAAYEAQKEVAAAVKYFRRFDKRSKTIDPDYMDQIEALLARFDLGSTSLKELSRRKSLLAWVESQRAQGIEPEIVPELLNEAYRQSYKDMTVEEIRGLRDTVKQIEHLGRVKNRLLTARDKRTYEQIRDEITASINEHAGDRTANTRTPDTALGRWMDRVKKFGAEHIKAAAWARILDGGKDGGPVWEHFVRGANERGDMETTMRADATKALSEILAPVLKAGKMSAKTFFPSINRSLTREAVFAIALNTGNQSNLQRLLGGEGWSIGQLQPILDTLSAQDWQAVQAIWDHFENYRPQIAAKQRRVYGSEPDWIDPTPVVTKFGTLKGGYFPVKYDPNASVRAEEHADAEAAAQQLRGAYTSSTTRRSFTKSRAEEVVGRPLLYTLQGVYGGVNEVIHDLAWHEWLIDANRLLRSDAIDSAIRSHYGPQVVRQFKTWVEAIAEGDSASSGALEIALGALRRNVSVAGLGYNAVTAATQFLGAPQSIARIGVKWFGMGLQQYIAHPVAKTREVNAKSAFMANRARTRFRELNELRNRVQGDNTVRQAVLSNAYVLMMRTQQMVDVPTWLGAYEKAVSEGNGEDRAIALADQAVIDAQGGGQTKDLSAIERGGPALKIYTSFYSFMNTQLNLLVSRGMTNHSAAKTIADVVLISMVPSMLMVLLKNALIPGDSGDEDDKLLRKLSAAGVEGLFGLFVLGREFAQLASMAAGLNDTALGYTGPSGLRLINDLYKFQQQAAQGELDDGLRKASINLMGSLLGLPSAQVNRTITGAQALSDNKTQNLSALVFGYQEPR